MKWIVSIKEAKWSRLNSYSEQGDSGVIKTRFPSQALKIRSYVISYDDIVDAGSRTTTDATSISPDFVFTSAGRSVLLS